MSRIIAYEEKAQIAANDYLVVDSSTDGTRKIKATNALTMNNYITGATADTVVAGRVIYDANIN